MEPQAHAGTMFVQGPFALKMILDLCECLPHHKGCFFYFQEPSSSVKLFEFGLGLLLV